LSDAFFVMKIANAALPQFSRQALRARNHRLSKCYCDDATASREEDNDRNLRQRTFYTKAKYIDRTSRHSNGRSKAAITRYCRHWTA
jgi:hypothetical protein